MSTEYVSRSRVEDIRARELREKEAARRKTVLEKRVGNVNASINLVLAEYSQLVSRLDNAKQKLPDLQYVVANLPNYNGGQQNVSALEDYQVEIKSLVELEAKQLELAIAEAERILADRLALARIHREYSLNKEALNQINSEIAEFAKITREEAKTYKVTNLTEENLVEAERIYMEAQTILGEAKQYLQGLKEMQVTIEALSNVSGDAVTAISAEQLNALDVVSRTEKRMQQIKEVFQQHQLNVVPESLKVLSQQVVEASADLMPWFDNLVARFVANNKSVAKAERLLREVPFGVGEIDLITERWQRLTLQLEQLLQGHAYNIHDLEREHSQMNKDAEQFLKSRYALAELLLKSEREGFEVDFRQPGKIILLGKDSTYLEMHYEENSFGGLDCSYQVFRDQSKDDVSDDTRIIDDTCAKLSAIHANGDEKVRFNRTEEINRHHKIRVKQRPKKQMTKQL